MRHTGRAATKSQCQMLTSTDFARRRELAPTNCKLRKVFFTTTATSGSDFGNAHMSSSVSDELSPQVSVCDELTPQATRTESSSSSSSTSTHAVLCRLKTRDGSTSTLAVLWRLKTRDAVIPGSLSKPLPLEPRTKPAEAMFQAAAAPRWGSLLAFAYGLSLNILVTRSSCLPGCKGGAQADIVVASSGMMLESARGLEVNPTIANCADVLGLGGGEQPDSACSRASWACRRASSCSIALSCMVSAALPACPAAT
mmetsp:Transcript_150513/g.382683  ORF Transcript_150513/g.382683 Transcript_150513/m.382683 type:complete len:255 (-) Transcript_150513:158-922(-)